MTLPAPLLSTLHRAVANDRAAIIPADDCAAILRAVLAPPEEHPVMSLARLVLAPHGITPEWVWERDKNGSMSRSETRVRARAKVYGEAVARNYSLPEIGAAFGLTHRGVYEAIRQQRRVTA